MKLQICKYSYAFDNGLNLIQATNGKTNIQRLITAQRGNQAISNTLYSSLGLTAAQKTNLGTSLINKNIFDSHGNQIQARPHDHPSQLVMQWDYRNQLQSTKTTYAPEEAEKEYYTYFKTGRRNRKVTSRQNSAGNTIQITESLYLGNLEHRTLWQGNDLVYDGEFVCERSSGIKPVPTQSYWALRIRQGHKQVATIRRFTHQIDSQNEVDVKECCFTLSDNIDSCSLTINQNKKLESFESYKPYGSTAISYGKTELQPYKYSAQEKDTNGLYFYGFRSLLPTNFRWISPDPSGIRGSALNWYAMTGGNPVTIRDKMGLVGEIYDLENVNLDNLEMDDPVYVGKLDKRRLETYGISTCCAILGLNNKLSSKHDAIFVHASNISNYIENFEDFDRVYFVPGPNNEEDKIITKIKEFASKQAKLYMITLNDVIEKGTLFHYFDMEANMSINVVIDKTELGFDIIVEDEASESAFVEIKLSEKQNMIPNLRQISADPIPPKRKKLKKDKLVQSKKKELGLIHPVNKVQDNQVPKLPKASHQQNQIEINKISVPGNNKISSAKERELKKMTENILNRASIKKRSKD